MTKFAFLSDTHIGANPIGFHQQPAYPEKMEELIAEIKALAREGEIDFVLHGGDMIDRCELETIQESGRLFQMDVPVYLSLGNHDVDRIDAEEIWLQHAPQFFNGFSPQYTIRHENCVIHVIPNQWEIGSTYYWEQAQNPYFTKYQLNKLKIELDQHTEYVHLLAIHNPIFGISSEQTGMDHVIHDVPAEFRETVLNLMHEYPHIKGVLSGHNHVNTLKRTSEGFFVSNSAFIETPFAYKLIEITDKQINITSKTVDTSSSFSPKYNSNRAYVYGREQDRTMIWNLEG
ncbi:metallophosphoesterase [Paenibacillus motobuensis]|uniref:metallophosphoesterase family protein n=1 Tax=Paenibacillus TaxID=44249 RepID=UPI00203BE21A|nr:MULTISPECIES: metallophosphoesterase [Paenibacillus]MCM3041297.1 metallophosphoesterase [Paenibacillus lutimineralis]MCM3648401.1 metallophosphoesterase [Paenibacillus motobuensis]